MQQTVLSKEDLFIAIYRQTHIIPKMYQVATFLKIMLLTSHLSFPFLWWIILYFPFVGVCGLETQLS